MTNTTGTPSFETLLANRAESMMAELRTKRAGRLKEIPTETRVWLAIAPAWTFKMAEKIDFPCVSEGVEATLKMLEREGLCRVDRYARNGVTGALEPRFWMPPPARASTLEDVLADQKAGYSLVADAVGTVGKRIADLPEDDVLPQMRRWAELARHVPDLRAVGNALASRVAGCVNADRPDDALAWIEAGRPLGELLGGELVVFVGQQTRRVDLVFRRRDDKRYLERFVRRRGQIDEFRSLIDGIERNDDRWALHFIGGGGMGKTMLLRYINSEWAEEIAKKRGHAATTARIDFDHINPEFPSRAPALLLAHLAQDLRLHATDGTAASSFSSFDAKLDRLHQRARGRSPIDLDVTTTSDEFAELLDAFASALEHLPQPIVLLLDTCEELAKARLRQAALPDNIRATFDILEALHARFPALRVVFSGRRPLASDGAGWTLPGNPYPAREYMRLHEVQGFTAEEAENYLRNVSKVRSDLVEPILAASAERPELVGFVYDDQDSVVGTTEPRTLLHSPFILSLYGRWSREDESLTGDVIRAGDTDAYVDMRVVGRVRRPALQELLPGIAELGWFDRDTLRALSPAGDAEFEDAIRELWEQDWLNRPGGDLFEVKPSLRRRLLRYFRRIGNHMPGDMRDRGIAHLLAVTANTELADLSVSHFDVLIRLLEHQPARAFEWWDSMEERFAESGQTEWARTLVERLLSEEGVAGETPLTADGERGQSNPLRPAVLATYAAVLARDGATTNLEPLLDAVQGGAGNDPRSEGKRRLEQRAIAARVLAQRGKLHFVSAAVDFMSRIHPIDGTPAMRDRVASEWVAAAEAIAEEAEVGSIQASQCRRGTDRLAELTASAGVSVEIVAMAFSVAARIARLANDEKNALDLWRRALRHAGSIGGLTRQRWIGWYAPDDAGSRVRLEFVRSAFPALTDAPTALRLVSRRVAPPTTIDADRLTTAVLRLRGATGAPDLSDLREWARSTPEFTSLRCQAHTAVPPSFALFCQEDALGFGAVDAALDELQLQFRRVESGSTALPVLSAIEITRLRIARRMRLRDEERIGRPASLAQAAGMGQQFVLETAVAGLDARSHDERVGALNATAPQGIDEPEWIHRLWRSFAIIEKRDAETLMRRAVGQDIVSAAHSPSYGGVSCAIDLLETVLIASAQKLPAPHKSIADTIGGKPVDRVNAFIKQWPLAFEEHLRLLLRLDTLDSGEDKRIASAAERLGHRFAAQIAFEEGELMALRLPSHAREILARSAKWFADSNDTVGETLVRGCLTLASIRAGTRLQLGRVVDRLAESYGRMQGSGVRVPEWSVLEAMAEQPDRLGELPPGGWRPWLVRIVGAIAWRAEWRGPGERCIAVGNWIAANFASSALGEQSVPPELVPWWDARSVRRLSAERISLPVQVQVASREAWTSLSGAQGSDVVVRIKRSDADPISITGKMLSSIPYEEVARRGFPTAHDRVREYFGDMLPQELEAAVELGVAGGCWEAIIASWVGCPVSELRFGRLPARVRGVSNADAKWEVAQVLSFYGDYSAGAASASGWNSVSKTQGDVNVQIHTANEAHRVMEVLAMPVGREGVRLVHIVGTAQMGRGDVGIQLGSSRDAFGTKMFTEASVRSGEVLRPRDLAFQERGRGVSVYVLQAPPTYTSLRTAADRENADFMRLVATELTEVGAAGVITIPPLWGDQGAACLNRVVDAVRLRSGTIRGTLVDLVTLMRGDVMESDAPDDLLRAEGAADICLVVNAGSEALE